MDNMKVPYLCGGVLFFLLTKAALPDGTARDHQAGLKDEHSEPLLMRDLIYTFTGSNNYGAPKDTSKYKDCLTEGSSNVPFHDIAKCTIYGNMVAENYSSALKRMDEFVDWHLDPEMRRWFVKAVLEVIENDSDILENDAFFIMSDGSTVTKKEIKEMTNFDLSAFLVGVLHYVLNKRRGHNALGKRLSFIVNGEVEMGRVPKNQVCPFCDGKLPARDRKSYIASAQAELDRITLQMGGLEETEKDLETEKAEIEVALKELQAKRNTIEALINNELQPKADALRESLNGYRVFIQIKQELSVIDDFASSWETDLRELPSEDETPVEYHPKEYFGDTFQERIDQMLKDALIECAYDNLTTARFNMKDFDVEVNGHKKADIHGQGYCSYLNTIVALTFRRYMETYAKYNPGFVVIDTPLLGLDQGVNDAAPESMRTALFKYFISHQSDGQIIILENMMHIPVLDYEGAGANVITFTKGLEVGRYGFLNDVK